MDDRAKFDAQLEAPLPGRARVASVSTLRSENDSLRSLAAWASVQGG